MPKATTRITKTKGQVSGKSAKSTLPVPHEKCGCALVHFVPQACSKSTNCVKIHALLPNYCGRKYINNYSNTASGVPAYLGLFVSCLLDRLVYIVSDLPLCP